MATYKGKLKTKTANGADVLYPETSADMVTGLSDSYVTKGTEQTITGNKTFIGQTLRAKATESTSNYFYVKPDGNGYNAKIGFQSDNLMLSNSYVYSMKHFIPNGSSYDLGISSNKWRDLYLSGSLKDGTNSITVAKIENTDNKVTSISSSSTDIQYPSAKAVYTAIEGAIQGVGNPMVFKGSLGTGGTITTLPAAATVNKGYTYKVITAGTYQSLACKVGDVVVSDGTSWTLIPSGDEPSGTVTSVGLSAPTGFSVSGSPVTSSGTLSLSFASGYSLPTTAKQTEWDSKADGDHTHANMAVTNADNNFSATQTFKNITLYSASGDSPRLTFQRGTLTDGYNDWSLYDSSGYLYIQQRGNGYSAWETRAVFDKTSANFQGTLKQGGKAVATQEWVTSQGYTTNVGTVTSVNGNSPDSDGNVSISIPSAVTESTVSGWGFTKNEGTVKSVNGTSPDANGNVSISEVMTNYAPAIFWSGSVTQSGGSRTLSSLSGVSTLDDGIWRITVTYQGATIGITLLIADGKGYGYGGESSMGSYNVYMVGLQYESGTFWARGTTFKGSSNDHSSGSVTDIAFQATITYKKIERLVSF